MATDFPNSPANGATHTFGGTTYTYSTSVGAWTAGSSAGGASVTVSETAPSSPAEGDLWFDPSVLKTFVYYNDGSANQWVQSNPTGSGGGGSAGASVTASDTAPSSPSAGDLWYKSDTNALYVYYNDGDSSQWVGVSGPAGATGAAGAPATGYGQVPIVYTEPPTSHTLNQDGSTSTVQMQAVDPEGTAITYAIAYANATNARPNQLAADTTINQSTGTFTFDPSTNTSHAGTFKARLSASDGITSATRFVNFSLAFAPSNIELLVVAGGGGGGGAADSASGGGGAGGLLYGSSISVSSGTTYNIVVGAGGAASSGTSQGNSGQNSAAFGCTAIGGGGGGGAPRGNHTVGLNGGSGGGGTGWDQYKAAGSATQTDSGGATGFGSNGTQQMGGGAGGSGNISTSTPPPGKEYTQFADYGSPGGWYASGGSSHSVTAANGGGTGGQGTSVHGVAAAANTGGGGAGCYTTSGSTIRNGGAGGSGIVAFRYADTYPAPTTTGNPIEVVSGGYRTYYFLANGTVSW